jgi:hypothetical protein
VRKRILLAASLLTGIATSAFAISGSATLTVAGTINNSIHSTLSTSASTFTTVSATSWTLALGNISKYGSAPAGCTITRLSTSWTLNWTVTALVEVDGATSASYMLAGALSGGLVPSGVSWLVQGVTMLDTASSTVLTAASYGSTALSFQVRILDSTAVSALNSTVQLNSIAN